MKRNKTISTACFSLKFCSEITRPGTFRLKDKRRRKGAQRPHNTSCLTTQIIIALVLTDSDQIDGLQADIMVVLHREPVRAAAVTAHLPRADNRLMARQAFSLDPHNSVR